MVWTNPTKKNTQTHQRLETFSYVVWLCVHKWIYPNFMHEIRFNLKKKNAAQKTSTSDCKKDRDAKTQTKQMLTANIPANPIQS